MCFIKKNGFVQSVFHSTKCNWEIVATFCSVPIVCPLPPYPFILYINVLDIEQFLMRQTDEMKRKGTLLSVIKKKYFLYG